MSLAFNGFNEFLADAENKIHDLSTDALKIMLTNVAPVATNSVKADLTEIANGNGYTTGGTALTAVTSSQTGGTYKLLGTGPTFTASGGTMATFRYIVLYNSAAAGGPLIGWWDNGSTVSLADTEQFVVSFSGTNGILQAIFA